MKTKFSYYGHRYIDSTLSEVEKKSSTMATISSDQTSVASTIHIATIDTIDTVDKVNPIAPTSFQVNDQSLECTSVHILLSLVLPELLRTSV